MDRSQVRQFGLNRSIYSSKVMGMSSSILHSPRSNAQRQIHLRKSRIANIPDSKNIDLSQKLDFVVVFQSIEIERMAEEIATARSRIKEYERQLFNCDNYEVQIKQLTERCYRLQSQKNSYREELFENKRASELIFNELEEIKKRYVTVDFTTSEKYKLEKGRNDELVLEVQKWKARYNALDQSKSKELETIKKIMSDQSKSHLSRQTKELFDRFEIQKEEMQEMIKNLKQMNLEKQTELKKCKFELETKEKQLDEMERQVDQYEEKVALLSQEHYRLSEMNKSKQVQITKLKDKIKDSDEQSAKISQELQLKSEEHKKLSLKVKKIEQTANQKDSKLTKLQKMSLNDKERLSELDRIVFLLKERQNEIESKTKMMERKDKKIISLEESLKTMQQTEISTKKQLTTLKQQSVSASQTITQLLQRIQNLTSLIKKVKLSASASFQSIKSHNLSLRQEMNTKTQQIMVYSQKLIGQISENESYINRLEEVIKVNGEKIQAMELEKLTALEKLQELKEYEVQYDRVEKESIQLKKKVNNILEQNDKLIEQHRLLHEQKNTLVQEKKGLVKQNSMLLKEKNNLIEQTEMKQSQIMNQTQRQIQIIQEKYENNIIKNIKQQLLVKDKQLSSKIKEITDKARELSEKQKLIASRDRELISKDNEINEMRVDLSSMEKRHKQSEKQLKQALEKMSVHYESSIKMQIEALIARIQPMQSTIKSLKQFLSQKVIAQQKILAQKHKTHQRQLAQLIDFNLQLIDKNHKLYEALLSSSIDTNSLDLLTISPTTYTSKTIHSPRNTNENYNSSNIVGVGAKIKQTIKANFSNQTSSSIPVDFLIKHVLLCAELESLRQRIGDKNAKVEKMKNSLMVSNVSSNKSFVAVVNGNTKMFNQHIHHPSGDMMLESNLMSSTLINKLNNPFINSIVGNMNNDTSFIHQSRLIQHTERQSGQSKELNIRRVISEERYPGASSPDNSSIMDNSQNKNTGIYTNRMSGSGIGFGRSGFKSIGIKKAKIYN